MANEFVLLKLRPEKDPRNWPRAVNIRQIVSIMPIHSEANQDPAKEAPDVSKPLQFMRAAPKDEAEVIARGLWGHFEVTDALGNVYWSDIGQNPLNDFLGDLYRNAVATIRKQ